LSDLNIRNPIDSAFFIDSDPEVNQSDYDLLYLFKNEIVYEIKLEVKSLMNGKLVPISVKQITIENIFYEIIGCQKISETQITKIASETTTSSEMMDFNQTIIIAMTVLIVSILCISICIAFFYFYSRKNGGKTNKSSFQINRKNEVSLENNIEREKDVKSYSSFHNNNNNKNYVNSSLLSLSKESIRTLRSESDKRLDKNPI